MTTTADRSNDEQQQLDRDGGYAVNRRCYAPMKINVHLEDVILPVECGEGRQKLKWLAQVSCTRYGLLQSELLRPPTARCQLRRPWAAGGVYSRGTHAGRPHPRLARPPATPHTG